MMKILFCLETESFQWDYLKVSLKSKWYILYQGAKVLLWDHLGESDVGDIVMLLTLWWWMISDVSGRIIMLAIFFVMLMIFSIVHQHPESVNNISNLSPTHSVSNIRHQHRCNRNNSSWKMSFYLFGCSQ